MKTDTINITKNLGNNKYEIEVIKNDGEAFMGITHDYMTIPVSLAFDVKTESGFIGDINKVFLRMSGQISIEKIGALLDSNENNDYLKADHYKKYDGYYMKDGESVRIWGNTVNGESDSQKYLIKRNGKIRTVTEEEMKFWAE